MALHLLSDTLSTPRPTLVMGVMYPPNILKTVQDRPSEFLGTPKHVPSSPMFAQSLQITNRLLSKIPSSFGILQFVFKILKILGQVPFIYDRNGGDGAYSFAWSSFGAIQSFVAAIIASFVWFILLTHHGLKKYVIFGPW